MNDMYMYCTFIEPKNDSVFFFTELFVVTDKL